ncbi:2,3-dihydroxybenzoate-AMP ligase [Antarctobacter heliothermus]|uniref:2,3-dihydroxybenzoate-AMP ligase n=1 Tax=Antarctobacter heliothermus TaxID=74033 RepID=A0A222E7A1_9RHOB|nr:non-ribosomal peptide synthetase [Antarctobacter heliothermus]ASP22075.1 2,3-dihydroxybenzoate-AMP ligase [Antarctobacter heliothermus]
MTPAELLREVRSRGGQITTQGEDLRVTGRVGSLPEDLRNEIRLRKSGIIELLQREDGAAPTLLPKDGKLPVSHFQERLWIIQKLDPKATEYNLVTVWPFGTRLEPDALEAAVKHVVTRHGVLRTSFRETPTGPVAIMLEPDLVPVESLDLEDLNDAARKAAVDEAIRRETARPFDLENGAPARFTVLGFGADGAALMVAAHHIAIDHWSLSLLREEILAAAAEGTDYVARAPQLEYPDYAGWQRQQMDPARLAPHLDWWEETLRGHPDLCAFNADLIPKLGWDGTSESFEWDAEFSEKLNAFCQSQHVTLYMALLAASALALHRETGLEDIVLGSPVALREKPEFERMIGPFVNTQVLRMGLTPRTPFVDLLATARQSLLDSHPHSHVPFEMVVERAMPARRLNRSPLFQFAVVLQSAAGAPSEPIYGGGAIHDMTWFVRQSEGRIMGAIEYRTDIYLPETVKRLLARLEAILRHAVDHPETPVADFPLLSDQERDTLLSEFVPAPVEIEPAPWPKQVARQAQATPEAVAIRTGDHELSYAGLNTRANRLAHHLASREIGQGAVVGLCLDRSADLITAMLAVHKAGAAYVPLDPGFPPDRLAYILRDSGASAVLTGGDAARSLDMPDGVAEVDVAQALSHAAPLPESDPEVAIAPSDRSHLIYTSGSTGRPKGVDVTHGALSNLLEALRREPGMSASDVVAATTTVSFDIAAVELQLPLTVGARIEMLDREVATNGEALADALRDSDVTVLQATPSAWRLLLEADWAGSQDLLAISGGEALTRDLADALLERVGRLWNGYGPSETTIYSTGCWIDADGQAVSIGRPVANTRVYLLDEAGALVPIGMQGEIWIGGAGVATGYVGLPEQTQDRFLPDPFDPKPGARCYRTGDIGRWSADGRLFHLGRGDHQVKIRGVRIELGEVEAALLGIEQIRQAAVVVEEAGPDDLRLVAYVVYEPGSNMTVSQVRRSLRATLPRLMVPSVIMDLPTLPRTPNGKLDRKALPKPFERGRQREAVTTPPRPGIETTLAAIWREVLKVDNIGAESNFFELGGHSLLTLRVAKQVETQMGVPLDPRVFFFNNLRQIAAVLSQQVGPKNVK